MKTTTSTQTGTKLEDVRTVFYINMLLDKLLDAQAEQQQAVTDLLNTLQEYRDHIQELEKQANKLIEGLKK